MNKNPKNSGFYFFMLKLMKKDNILAQKRQYFQESSLDNFYLLYYNINT